MEQTKFDFQKNVIESSKSTPLVVDFWAEWCAPCRMLGPVLEKLAEEANGSWKLIKVNTEEHPQVAADYRIQGIPAVKMFYNGEVIAEFVGALPEVQVRSWLDENLPTKSKELLHEAKEALGENGNLAQELLEQAINEDENNFEAKILLAEKLFESDPEKADDLVGSIDEGNPFFKKATSIRTLLDLQRRFEDLSKHKDKSSAWNYYVKGIEALRNHDYEASLENWIEALLIDKGIDDDGSRRSCIALFEWLGRDHELTEKFHRSFTSALF